MTASWYRDCCFELVDSKYRWETTPWVPSSSSSISHQRSSKRTQSSYLQPEKLGGPLKIITLTSMGLSFLTVGVSPQRHQLLDLLSRTTTFFQSLQTATYPTPCLTSMVKPPTHAREVSQSSRRSSTSQILSIRPGTNFWEPRTPRITRYLRQTLRTN